jgi:leucyl-tRNA synthetase
VEGANRFLRRLWRLVARHVAAGPAPALDPQSLDDHSRDIRRKIHETIAKVSDDYGRRLTFNTAIAAVMELCNELGELAGDDARERAVLDEALNAVVRLLCPIVPHLCHHLWHALGHKGDVTYAAWPTVDESALVRDSVEMVVQVNGKVRAKMTVPAAIDKAGAEAEALRQPNAQRFLEGKTVRKVIVVPGKLVNVVAG